MIKDPIQADISHLQQDKPANEDQFANSKINVEPIAKKWKPIEDVKPFFLYPRDGLYGLL